MSLTAVNLLWQHRFRGLAPVTTHAAADDGRSLLIRPDEFERRTYQILSVDAAGNSAELGAISVETVHRWDGTPDGKLLLGMTNDDVYLIREGRKARFMADRRLAYSDVCMSPGSGCFVCAYSDALNAAHGIAFGDANGRLGWSRAFSSPVNQVTISLDGHSICVGLQDGRIAAVDLQRSLLWETPQQEQLSAIVMPGAGVRPVAGTAGGSILAMDDDGGYRWRASVGLPVVALATDAEGQWVTAVLSDGATHAMTCLGPDGVPVWEFDLETRPTGISLSPGGKYLLLSTANGTASLFEMDFAASSMHGVGFRRDRDLEEARAAIAEDGDLVRARDILISALVLAPHDLDAAADLADLERRMIAERREEGRTLLSEGRSADALAALNAASAIDPWHPELFEERRECRRQAIDDAERRAVDLEQARQWAEATGEWSGVLAMDPHRTEARQALARIRAEEAKDLTAEGDERREAGDLPGARERWQQAQRLRPSEDLEARLRKADVEACVAAGVSHYEAGRMPEAAFQLRKAIALDPDNETARRYLGYTGGAAGDTQVADRFARLE